MPPYRWKRKRIGAGFYLQRETYDEQVYNRILNHVLGYISLLQEQGLSPYETAFQRMQYYFGFMKEHLSMLNEIE